MEMVSYKSTEMKLLKLLGAVRYAASGALDIVEDGTDGRFQIQLKVTGRDYYRLLKDDLKRLVLRAYLRWNVPLFVIYFEQNETFTLVYPVSSASDDVKVMNKEVKLKCGETTFIRVEGLEPSLWAARSIPSISAKKYLDSIIEECRKVMGW